MAYDVYCIICGNTNHNFDIKKNFYNIHDEIDDKNMIKKIKIFEKKTKWLENIVFITSYDKIIHNVIGDEYNFKDTNGQSYHLTETRKRQDLLNEGYFLHLDCWKYINNKYKIKLKYSDIPFNVIDKIRNKFLGIEIYYNQFFDFNKIISDEKYNICYSPLKDKTISLMINKIIKELKIKNDSKRKSPNTSATFYKDNVIKVGNDGNFWMIKNKKWYLLKDEVNTYNLSFEIKDKIYNDKLYKMLLKIPGIGEENDKPIFIKDATLNKKIYTVTILYNDDTKMIIKKIYQLL